MQMLKNNNDRVIVKMAKRSLISGKQRNLIMILAILLSTFMLFSILTVGNTFFKMQRIQDLRMKGADFDAYVYGGFTGEQKVLCENDPALEAVGVEGFAAWAVETEADDTLNTCFIWADEAYWNGFRKPVTEWVKGSYPQKENEVMVTKDALKDCGLDHLEIGDTFTMTYMDKHGEHTRDFTISGMWEGYGNTEISGITVCCRLWE